MQAKGGLKPHVAMEGIEMGFLVRKRSGALQEFSRGKIEASMVKAGAPKKTAALVAAKVERLAAAARKPVPTTRLREWVNAELARVHKRAAQEYKSFRKTALKLRMEHPPEALLDRLQAIVGAAGKAMLAYSGFEIRVHKPEELEWGRILNELLDYGFAVWIVRKDGVLAILAKE